MSEFLRDVLAERARISPPVVNAADVVARAEARIRRRRVISMAAAAISAAVIATSLLVVPSLVGESTPVDRPARFLESKLTYAQGTVVHYGDQEFDIGVPVDLTLARTDYGFVVASWSGNVWFSDGSDAEKIGEIVDPRSLNSLWADASGPHASWMEESERGFELVVYDTRAGEVVARIPAVLSRPGATPPRIVAIDGDTLYWDSGDQVLAYDIVTGKQDAVDLPFGAIVLDVADGALAYVTPELGNRQIVVGQPGGGFTIKGLTSADLSPDGSYVADLSPTVHDAATGERITLRPPRGYQAHQYMGWVDDHTIAAWDADQKAVLTCAMPSGSCRVAAKEPARAWRPLFPGGHRPG